MRKFETWIINQREEQPCCAITFEELYCIGRELERHEVSVKASNIFPITHMLVANVGFTLEENDSIHIFPTANIH